MRQDLDRVVITSEAVIQGCCEGEAGLVGYHMLVIVVSVGCGSCDMYTESPPACCACCLPVIHATFLLRFGNSQFWG
jgi:hypothetical protein